MNLARTLAEARALTASTRNYVPHELHAKQKQFLELVELEALYGGAAGGGKSDALLAAALQYVHIRGYAALILRRTYSDLALPDAIMARSHEWLDGTDAVWNEQKKRWTFPSGAILQFGFCDTARHLARYKSAQFQFIGIDELTEWPELWYRFLFSRLRRLKGSTLPIRMRAATNPDGLGQEWVRLRFGIPLGEVVNGPIANDNGKRVFLPARAEDNPSLDLEAYEASLEQLGPQKYEQLRWGRWVRDGEGLVYKFSAERNVLEEPLDTTGWKFVLGIDYGFKDSTAFVILGWDPYDDSKTVYVVRSFKIAGLTPSKAARIVKELEGKYHFSRIVGDVGGLGKAYAEEARARFRVPVEAAEKNNKRAYIELLNGDLLAARLMLFPGNEELIAEWVILPWDEDKQAPAEGFEDHLSDGTLYGYRACYAWNARADDDDELPPAARDAAAPAKEAFLNRRARDAKKKKRPWWAGGKRRRAA